jgi:filamentous hemagglutinin family protein
VSKFTSVSSLLVLFPFLVFAGPTGEKVVHGKAKVERPSNNLLEVTQEGPRAIVEWDQFSLGQDEVARFIQPNRDSAILNRVVGGNLSEIYGRMEANGHVFVVNPQGVLVGETGRIDCAGFVASGLNLGNESFIGGDTLTFDRGDGTVVNKGQIAAHGGKVYLIGADVRNEGVATADQGVFIQISNEASDVIVRTKAGMLENGVDNAFALAMNQDGMEDVTEMRIQNGRLFLGDEVSMAPAFQYVDVTGVPFANGGVYVEQTQNALQQLGSVIPERLWYQRFAILIDQNRFHATHKNLPGHANHFGLDAAVSVGESQYYFMQNTVSGDTIRINDDYQQFLDSPYWKNPIGMEKLTNLQNKVLK